MPVSNIEKKALFRWIPFLILICLYLIDDLCCFPVLDRLSLTPTAYIRVLMYNRVIYLSYFFASIWLSSAPYFWGADYWYYHNLKNKGASWIHQSINPPLTSCIRKMWKKPTNLGIGHPPSLFKILRLPESALFYTCLMRAVASPSVILPPTCRKIRLQL